MTIKYIAFVLCLCGVFASTISFAIPESILTKIDDLVRLARVGGNTTKTLYNVVGALSKREISKLADLAKSPGGLEKVGAYLAKGKYSDDILENAYIRIAIENKVITKEFGEDVFKNLSGTDGLRTLVRKINISNLATSKGHLTELQIANESVKRGFRPISLGLKYPDDIKQGMTDMDILVEKNGQLFAVESKSYLGNVPMDIVRADTESLLKFSSSVKETIPVFSFSRIPPSVTQRYLQSKNVSCLYGTPEEIAYKLDHLAQLCSKKQ